MQRLGLQDGRSERLAAAEAWPLAGRFRIR